MVHDNFTVVEGPHCGRGLLAYCRLGFTGVHAEERRRSGRTAAEGRAARLTDGSSRRTILSMDGLTRLLMVFGAVVMIGGIWLYLRALL